MNRLRIAPNIKPWSDPREKEPWHTLEIFFTGILGKLSTMYFHCQKKIEL
jgi:hypothetical protein